jgi:ATP-dependent Lon protease
MTNKNDNYYIETRSRKRQREEKEKININENITLEINDSVNFINKKRKNDYYEDPLLLEEESLTNEEESIDEEEENSLDGFIVDDDDEEYEDENENENENEDLTLFGKNINTPLVDLILKNMNNNGNNNKYYKEEYDSCINPIDYYEYVDKLNDNEKENLKNTISRIKNINSRKDIPLKYRILSNKFDDKIKAHCLLKYVEYDKMEDHDTEKNKISNYLENLMDVPFGNYVENKFDYNTFKEIDNNLNKVIYGMDNTKENIMSFVATWINNPDSVTTPFALMGPPGTGKTTIVRDGIAKSLKRPFIQINLGGFKDSNSLLGHDYTYIGSKCGLLVESLINAKVMNPIIYFDELDKIPEQGLAEISGVLIHLIDPSQNSSFKDKYFSSIDFDFSKALFIFSFNDINNVDKILLDRLSIIKTNGYNKEEKRVIINNYMFKNILQNIGLSNETKHIEDDKLNYIIDNYTDKEEGVRNLNRCIYDIYSKLNLYNIILREKDENNLLLNKFKKNKNYELIKKDILENKLSNTIIDLFLKKNIDNKPNVINTMYL